MSQGLQLSLLTTGTDLGLTADKASAATEADTQQSGLQFGQMLSTLVPAEGGNAKRQIPANVSLLSGISLALAQQEGGISEAAEADSDSVLAQSLLGQIAMVNHKASAKNAEGTASANPDIAEAAKSLISAEQSGDAEKAIDTAGARQLAQLNKDGRDLTQAQADETGKGEKLAEQQGEQRIASDLKASLRDTSAEQTVAEMTKAVPDRFSSTVRGEKATFKPDNPGDFTIEPINRDKLSNLVASGSDAESTALASARHNQAEDAEGDKLLAADSGDDAVTAEAAKAKALLNSAELPQSDIKAELKQTSILQNATQAESKPEAGTANHTVADAAHEAATKKDLTSSSSDTPLKGESKSALAGNGMLNNSSSNGGQNSSQANQQAMQYKTDGTDTGRQQIEQLLQQGNDVPQAAKASTEQATVLRNEQNFIHSLAAAEQRQQVRSAAVEAKKPAEQLKQNLNLMQQDAAGQLKERVTIMLRQNIQVAEIRLDPAGLGQMQIKIDMQQDQASVQFIVQQSQAKELLEQQLPRLREMLQQQGIQLSEGQVQQQSQQQDRQWAQRDGKGGQPGQAMTDDVEGIDGMPAVNVQVNVSERLVDYYA